MKALVLTNEFPPNVYGGAGIHVTELTGELRRRMAVEVRAFGDQDEADDGWRVRGYRVSPPGPEDSKLRGAWDAFARDLAMAADPVDADLVHCHTWYSHLAGILVQRAYGIPLIVTVHSLEPMRPWKREQLGGVRARDDHQMTVVVREAIEDGERPLGPAEDQAFPVIARARQIAEDAARLLVGASDVCVTPRSPEMVHGGRVAEAASVEPTAVFHCVTVTAMQPLLVESGRPRPAGRARSPTLHQERGW